MRHVLVSTGATEFEGFVADDAELDDVFTLISSEAHDLGEQYRFKGWLVTVADCGHSVEC